ncbi:MAG: hypothetical protein R3362_13430, partial [Rhodothermales bacterium]|nr:hypothetical protein [Rhodothermales bacterium]
MSQEHMTKPGRGPGGVLRAAALGALWCFFAAAASAQSGHCDPQVRVSGSSPLGYSARGTPSENTDRCEGTYSLQVSSQALQIASFTRSFEAYEPSEVEALHV